MVPVSFVAFNQDFDFLLFQPALRFFYQQHPTAILKGSKSQDLKGEFCQHCWTSTDCFDIPKKVLKPQQYLQDSSSIFTMCLANSAGCWSGPCNAETLLALLTLTVGLDAEIDADEPGLKTCIHKIEGSEMEISNETFKPVEAKHPCCVCVWLCHWAKNDLVRFVNVRKRFFLWYFSSDTFRWSPGHVTSAAAVQVEAKPESDWSCDIRFYRKDLRSSQTTDDYSIYSRLFELMLSNNIELQSGCIVSLVCVHPQFFSKI